MIRICWISLLILFACAPSAPDASPPRLTVFAASSLREAFTALQPGFEAAHPGAQVVFSFAGSQELRTQLEHGALADVFASADQAQMAPLVASGRVREPSIFARNELVLAVRREAADELRSLADLPAAKRVVLGGAEVPVGRYAAQVLDRAESAYGAGFRGRVEARVVSREPNVRQVVAKLRLGEADAALVYRSDLAAAGPDVVAVAIPPELNAIAEYPVAVVAETRQPALAAAWIALLSAPEGARALSSAGLRPVTP